MEMCDQCGRLIEERRGMVYEPVIPKLSPTDLTTALNDPQKITGQTKQYHARCWQYKNEVRKRYPNAEGCLHSWAEYPNGEEDCRYCGLPIFLEETVG